MRTFTCFALLAASQHYHVMQPSDLGAFFSVFICLGAIIAIVQDAKELLRK